MIAIGAPIIDSGQESPNIFDALGITTPGLTNISAINKNKLPSNAVIGITYKCFEVPHNIIANIGHIIPIKDIGPVNATTVAVKMQESIINSVLSLLILTPILIAYFSPKRFASNFFDNSIKVNRDVGIKIMDIMITCSVVKLLTEPIPHMKYPASLLPSSR